MITTPRAKKMCQFIMDHNSHFLSGFLTSCTNGNRNEYFTEELPNLQLYPVYPHYLTKPP